MLPEPSSELPLTIELAKGHGAWRRQQFFLSQRAKIRVQTSLAGHSCKYSGTEATAQVWAEEIRKKDVLKSRLD